MKIGSTPITDIKVGSTQITKVIRNGVTYWEAPWTPQYFIFELTTTIPNTSITLPHLENDGLDYNYIYNYTIDHGDNSGLKTVTSFDDPNCTHIYSIAGTYQVRMLGICESFFVNTNVSGIKDFITKIVSWGNVGLRALNFNECFNLVSVPSDLLGGLSQLTKTSEMIPGLFNSCTSLSSIGSGLFDYFISVQDFYATFADCTSLAEIPSGLFDNCIAATVFSATFIHCPIVEIPSGLFDNCPLVENFSVTFEGTLITSIPSGLFDNCPLVTDFWDAFYDCQYLATIPVGLFDHNPLVTNFHGIFQHEHVSSVSASIPSGLFDNCPLVTDFSEAFSGWAELVGVAPELWLRDPEPYGSGCFKGCIELDNYASIPAYWNNQ